MTGLGRFRDAQEAVYATALAELQGGRKRSHWMWFVLPQLRGLGRSATAMHYGIAGLDEAQAYLADPVLGDRLRDAVAAVLQHPDRRAEEILGPVDALKFHSCLTLFERAAPGDPLFGKALDTFYGGERCAQTLAKLG